MAKLTLGGNPVETLGELPKVGEKAIDFRLITTDLSHKTLADFKGKKLVLNIFPSIDTGTCAASVREFNKRASSLENTVVACVSRDLPFAQARFCDSDKIENLIMLSDFGSGKFGFDYNLKIITGPLTNLLSRAIIIINEDGTIVYTQQVPEIVDEPNYEEALNAL